MSFDIGRARADRKDHQIRAPPQQLGLAPQGSSPDPRTGHAEKGSPPHLPAGSQCGSPMGPLGPIMNGRFLYRIMADRYSTRAELSVMTRQPRFVTGRLAQPYRADHALSAPRVR